MAERFSALLFMLSFVFQSSLAAESITAKNWPKFAGAEWGSSAEAVKKALEEKGYKCEKPKTYKGHEMLFFAGMLAGEKNTGACIFKSNKLWQLTVGYFENKVNYDAAAFGAKLTEILSKKYGEPIDISNGKKEYLTWANSDDKRQRAILLEIIAGERISVTYNSLAAVEARKKEKEQAKKSEEDF
jgi:hypothetical protein